MDKNKNPENYRHEFKYTVDDRLASIIIKYIEKIGLKKSSVHNGTYTVTSLYFDTPTFGDHYAKIGGFSHRKKLRARIYQDAFFNQGSDSLWIEVKEKHDMNILKRRASVSRDVWNRFLDTNCPIKSGLIKCGKEAENFCVHYLQGSYRPHVVIRYKRTVFEANFMSDIRLTFDRDIEACKWSDYMYNAEYVPVNRYKTVMEIKFKSALPWWFGDLVGRFGLKRDAFSKYSNSVDSINRHNPIPR